MSPEYALVLAVSLTGLSIAIAAMVRSPTNTVRRMAQEAFERAAAMQISWDAFRADVSSTLGAIQDERERSVKARASARASQQRAEQANAGNSQPMTRDEELAQLRHKAGIL